MRAGASWTLQFASSSWRINTEAWPSWPKLHSQKNQLSELKRAKKKKMVRAPCCDKVGLKKGPWTQDEDAILTSYIQQHGHGNWRALPKHAGLLRCGKSCRLRWTNYLRPDIKRGNFTKEEEDAILHLHQSLGNRWSAIAGKLPGRTDNEIKNVWHTHLKKRLQNYKAARTTKGHSIKRASNFEHVETQAQSEQDSVYNTSGRKDSPASSHEPSSSELSSVTYVRDKTSTITIKNEQADISSKNFLGIDESFWSETLSTGNSSTRLDYLGELDFEFSICPRTFSPKVGNYVDACSSPIDDGMDFWYDAYMKAGELPEF